MKQRILAAAASLALMAAPAAAQDELTIMLDWFTNPNHGPIILAEELGYFDEAGLTVEIVPPADAALPTAMVAAGRVDLAISYQPDLHVQFDEGVELARVGALIASPLNCLLVKADGPIETLADLEGRRIGYSIAGVEYALMSALLEPVGLTTDDVEMIDVAFNLAPAVLTDQIDAAIGAVRNFQPAQMRLEGVEARCFNIEEHGVPHYDELIYVASAAVMREDAERRDAVRRFLEATGRAAAFIAEDPDAAWDIFRASSLELDGELNRAAWSASTALFALDPAAVDPARYVAFAEFLFGAGLIDAPQSANMLIIDLSAAD